MRTRAGGTPRTGTDAVAELDVASRGRHERGVLAATVAHLGRERSLGGLSGGRRGRRSHRPGPQQAGGARGHAGGRREFVGNGSEAVRALVEAWPLTPGETVLVPAANSSPTGSRSTGSSARRGTDVVELAEGGAGRLDPAAVEEALRDHRVGLVVVSHVPSQRGVVPAPRRAHRRLRSGGRTRRRGRLPVARARAGRPGAAAVAGTSRKWLHGPRGVGFAVVGAQWRPHLAGPPTLHSHAGQGADVRADPDVSVLEPREAAVAARVGLAAAVAELVAAGPDAVATRLAGLGVALRHLLLERVPALPLGEPVDEPSAIVTIGAAGPGRARQVVAALAAQGLRGRRPGRPSAGRARGRRPADPRPWVTHEHLERAADVVAAALSSR